MEMQNNSQKQIKDKNLSVIKEQLAQESLLNIKYNEYANQATDPEIKSIFSSASSVHKDNFVKLKSYLDSHQ
ncbi:hypothetical protein [Clostridium cylindrosporum]|uniref:Spore coat protein n=1 Tax=Clostridium cylindrosporum DSM 605 TaxID=1121307 RepID=A0A0J8D9Y4_CLOCY|nr:hypothetical protein [Clostridium cylindrosporum]KMT21103.1 hypothetical protein CLCY_1c03370 [Clostridium cylindrosporum DSM 605]